VAKFQKHFESSGQRQRKHVEHWKKPFDRTAGITFYSKRPWGGTGGEARLAELAAEVAGSQEGPIFRPVNEILKKSGLQG